MARTSERGYVSFGRLYSLAGALGLVLLLLITTSAARADTPIALRQSFAGNINFDSTGGSFRPNAGTGGQCPAPINATATGTLPPLPSGAQIVAAYLYWGHSASGPGVVDSNLGFSINGVPVTGGVDADRTFTAQFLSDPEHYGGAFADITTLITPSINQTTFQASGLNVFTGSPHCDFATVFGGFAVVVIYRDDANEPLRVINVFDGFQQFFGSEITLTPTNFRVPVAPIDGKQLVISWEGDAGNSGTRNGRTEGITYNNVNLPVTGDPFNPGNINPQNNDFNSTISAQNQTNVFGVDVDTYDLSTILQAGDTSGSTVYSTGQDYVLLTAEVISATNTAVSDLSIVKSHTGNFISGQNGTWTLRVTNNGPSDETGNIQVQDDLSALTGITYVNASGPGWSCSESGGLVTCDRAAGLLSGQFSDITLEVAVDGRAAPSVSNTATVVGTNFDNISGNNSSTDATTVLAGDLSTSTKVGVDENGGDLLNGDTILYTITITETAGVGVDDGVLVDDLDASLSGFAEVLVPAGAATSFNPTGGANGTGQWTVSNLDVPANGTLTLQFRVSVAGAGTGEAIDNRAVLTADSVVYTLDANTFIVDQSSLPASGDKPLYFSIDNSDSDGGGNDQPIGIQRALPIIPFAERDNRRVELDEPDTFVWNLTPGLVDDLVIEAGTVRVDLFLTEEGDGNQRDFRIDLERGTGGSFANATRTNVALSTTNSAPTLVTTFVNVGNETITPAQGLRIRLTNQSSGSSNRRIRVWMQSQSVTTNEFDSRSKLLIPTSTVVNIDTLGAFDDSFANGGGNAVGIVSPNEQIFLRAEVSDPFGTFDIAGATIRILDAAGTEVLATTPMVEEDDDNLIKTFETPFTPNDANLVPQTTGPAGDWTYTVIAEEGDSAEGVANQIFHTRNATFELGLPSLVIMKSSPRVLRDPINDPGVDPDAEPKRIPGAVVVYEIQVSNQGLGRPDGSDTLTISDVFPPGILLAVPAAGDPVSLLVDPSAGVSVDFATDVVFTFSTGTAPVDGDSDGCYDNVTGFTVTPTGQMDARVPPAAAPFFTLTYDACLQ